MAYNKNSQLSTFNFQFKKGFTLIELLITLSIAALVVLTIIMVYLTHFRVFINQNASFDVTSQAKIAVDEIVNQIREGQTIVNTCPSPNCLPGGVTTGTNALVLRLWRLDTNGEPDDTAYDYMTYNVSNNKVVKNIYPAATSSRAAVTNKILASSILAATDLAFTYDNPDPTQASQVTVSVTATQTTTAGAKTITSTQTGKAALRNKE